MRRGAKADGAGAPSAEGPGQARTSAPKVFVSHASEDKDRFVLGFARELRRRGIDAWLDRWEILPGDSLIDKLFEEGIRHAAAVIVVISKYSVEKPWVREELNAALVKRVNEGSLLIPVVLDGVTVPEALRSTVWESVDDLDDYQVAVDRVVSAVFGHRSRPPLGDPPQYAVTDLPSIYRLADTDVLTFKEFGAFVVEKGHWIAVDTETIWQRVAALGVSRQDFLDALRLLADRHWLEPGRAIGRPPPYFKVTVTGLEEYLTRFEPRYPEVYRAVVSEIVNANDTELENHDLVERLQAPKILIDHVLRRLKSRSLARVREAIGGHISVGEPHPSLRRSLR